MTSEQLAAIVMQFVLRSATHFSSELQDCAKQAWHLEPEEITLLDHEIFIATMWAASKAMEPDKRVLDALHDRYLRSFLRCGAAAETSGRQANRAQAELLDRYDIYYKALGREMRSDGWISLGFEMSQLFFPTRKPVLNADIHLTISMHMQLFIKHLLEARAEYKPQDA